MLEILCARRSKRNSDAFVNHEDVSAILFSQMASMATMRLSRFGCRRILNGGIAFGFFIQKGVASWVKNSFLVMVSRVFLRSKAHWPLHRSISFDR